jgi:hypothetical protein
MREYKRLLDPEEAPLVDVFNDIAALSGNRLHGDVQVGLKEEDVMHVRSVVMAITGMTSMHVIRTLRFFINKLAAFNNNPKEVFANFKTLQASVREAFKLLDVVQNIDRRWHLVSPSHVDDINSAVQSLFDRLSTTNRKDLEIRSDLPATLRKWADHKRHVT